MTQTATITHTRKRKNISIESLDKTEQKIHVNSLTQIYWEWTIDRGTEFDQTYHTLMAQLHKLEKNPYFSEDEVPEAVFANTRKMVDQFSDFLTFVHPEDIGTTPNGTVTIRFSKADSLYMNLEIGRSTLAYVVSDHNDLFIADQGNLDRNMIQKIDKALITYFN